MGNLLINRDSAKKFLEEKVVPNYRTLSEFEEWAGNYKGPFEGCLLKIRSYMREKFNKGQRFFEFGNSEIEQILDVIFLKDS